jgi:hypothetical protein
MFSSFFRQLRFRKYKKVVKDIQEMIEELNFQLENSSLEFEQMQAILGARKNLHQTITVILSVLLVHGIHWELLDASGEPYVRVD